MSAAEALRAEAGNSMLLDNGDIIQGNPMGDYIAYEKGLEGNVHPIIAAMNTLGYEAARRKAQGEWWYTRGRGRWIIPPTVILRRPTQGSGSSPGLS